jgi:hypothetical protein
MISQVALFFSLTILACLFSLIGSGLRALPSKSGGFSRLYYCMFSPCIDATCPPISVPKCMPVILMKKKLKKTVW